MVRNYRAVRWIKGNNIGNIPMPHTPTGSGQCVSHYYLIIALGNFYKVSLLIYFSWSLIFFFSTSKDIRVENLAGFPCRNSTTLDNWLLARTSQLSVHLLGLFSWSLTLLFSIIPLPKPNNSFISISMASLQPLYSASPPSAHLPSAHLGGVLSVDDSLSLSMKLGWLCPPCFRIRVSGHFHNFVPLHHATNQIHIYWVHRGYW